MGNNLFIRLSWCQFLFSSIYGYVKNGDLLQKTAAQEQAGHIAALMAWGKPWEDVI